MPSVIVNCLRIGYGGLSFCFYSIECEVRRTRRHISEMEKSILWRVRESDFIVSTELGNKQHAVTTSLPVVNLNMYREVPTNIQKTKTNKF